MVKSVKAKNRKEWRAWLRKNHKKEKKVFLICHKRHTGKPALSHKESMEEAICFGWIDTIVRGIDNDTYVRGFVRRTDNSRWSKNTLSYAKRLLKEKKMSKEGIKRYKEGLRKGVIDHGLPKNPGTPPDLKRELEKNKIAQKNFSNFAPSYKRMYIYWVVQAKRKETRQKRIKEVVKRSRENRKQ